MKLCNLRCAIASSFFLLCGLTGPEVSASVLFQNQSPGEQKTGSMIPSYDGIQAENFSLTNASSPGGHPKCSTCGHSNCSTPATLC
jgi:hypothetical protein